MSVLKQFSVLCLCCQEKYLCLQKQLADTESDLSDTRAALASRCQELSTLTETWTTKLHDVAARHNEELTAERQKALEVVASPFCRVLKTYFFEKALPGWFFGFYCVLGFFVGFFCVID